MFRVSQPRRPPIGYGATQMNDTNARHIWPARSDGIRHFRHPNGSVYRASFLM